MSVEFVSASQAADAVACDAPLRLVDTFGRVARDLRVSLTDRCNLRCSYCMPPEGLDWLPTEDTLTDDEVVRLIRIGVDMLGIRQVRFTGGEPLLRRGLEGIITECSHLRTDEGKPLDLALTTNALGLAKRAQGLKDAGRLADVLEGIEAAARAGLSPIKVNTLVLRGMNEADLPDLVDYCLDRGIELRVIEQMPIGPADTWDRQNIMTADEILHIMGTRHTLTPAPREDPHSPAGRWIVDGDPSKRLGVIASVSDPFCNACDRTRLTSDGMVRSCLFSTEETSLRDLLRGGGDDAQIAARWADAMWTKPAAHGLNLDAFARPSRTMSRIGG